MSKFLKKIPHVLVALPTAQKACRDKLQGILTYARRHGPWDVQLLEDRPFIVDLGAFENWYPDGIIARAETDLPAFRVPQKKKLPTVFLDPPTPCSNRCSSVSRDSQQIGEAVADYYLLHGLRRFAYVGSVPQSYWSSVRAMAFADRLKLGGYRCSFYEPENVTDWGIEQRHMLKWLEALPKPCGLFAAFDLQAKQVLDTCFIAGIRVPDEVAVIGVDNDETFCENTIPTLSSVQPDLENGGYLAAELLDQLMRGRKRRSVSLAYGIKRIVHRQSSQFIQKTDRLAATAIEFIRLNACEGITVLDVVQHLRVSRRLAELRFRGACGHSLLEEIQKHRLERVCELLRETNRPIHEIGERCGYPTETYLTVRFRRTFGMTMREYRKHPNCPVGTGRPTAIPKGGDDTPHTPEPDTNEAQVYANLRAQVGLPLETRTDRDILEACKEHPRSSSVIAATLGHKQLSGNLRKALSRLKTVGLLEHTIPNHPRSSLQRYRLTPRGHAVLVHTFNPTTMKSTIMNQRFHQNRHAPD